jgi:hypothetical protein
MLSCQVGVAQQHALEPLVVIEAGYAGERLGLERQLGCSRGEAQETGSRDRAAAATARSTALTSRTAPVSAEVAIAA